MNRPTLGSFKSDFQHLHELKTFVLKELQDFENGTLDFDVSAYNRLKGQYRRFKDGRSVRTLLTRGHRGTLDFLSSSPDVTNENGVNGTSGSGCPSKHNTNSPPSLQDASCSEKSTNALVSDRQLNCVGFFGQRRQTSEMPSFIPGMLWNMDGYLGEELQKIPGMLAQCYAEISHDGDWYNIVLLENECAVTHWSHSNLHRFAVR